MMSNLQKDFYTDRCSEDEHGGRQAPLTGMEPRSVNNQSFRNEFMNAFENRACGRGVSPTSIAT